MTDRPTTRHGVKRSRQRLGVPARAVAGLARRAFERGTPAEQLEGRVGAWARGRVHLNAGRTSSRLHGEHLFIFGDDDALVTVLCVPPTLLVELRDRGVDWRDVHPLRAPSVPMTDNWVAGGMPPPEICMARALGAIFRAELGPGADSMSPNQVASVLNSFAGVAWRSSAAAWRVCDPGERPFVHASTFCIRCIRAEDAPSPVPGAHTASLPKVPYHPSPLTVGDRVSVGGIDMGAVVSVRPSPASPPTFMRLVEGLPGCVCTTSDPDVVHVSAHMMRSMLSGRHEWRAPSPGEGAVASIVGAVRPPTSAADLCGRAVYEISGEYIGILGKVQFSGERDMWLYDIVRPSGGRD